MSEQDLKDLQLSVAELTGVPVGLITGETYEECHAQARAVLAFKRDYDVHNEGAAPVAKDVREVFKAWLMGEPMPQDPDAEKDLDLEGRDPKPRAKRTAPNSAQNAHNAAREQFKAWINETTNKG